MPQVWYVAYGSNLAADRFRCYLVGGRPLGGTRTYPGCRDPRDPVESIALELPGQLVFAGRSRVWGGGMAFYELAGSRTVACRGYRVTLDQFADVVAQEMRQPPGGEFAQKVAVGVPSMTTLHTHGPGSYETVHRLGERDGLAMLTVTSADVASLAVEPPRPVYLRWIATGLRESHGWTDDQIASYLIASPGVDGTWDQPTLRSLLLAE